MDGESIHSSIYIRIGWNFDEVDRELRNRIIIISQQFSLTNLLYTYSFDFRNVICNRKGLEWLIEEARDCIKIKIGIICKAHVNLS